MPVEAVCPTTGKRQMTYEVATVAAKRQRRNRDQRVSAYRCKCGWWHVGSQTQRLGKRRNRAS